MRKTLMIGCAALLSFNACFASDHKAPQTVQKRAAAMGGASDSSKRCEAGELSVPNSENDPCDQNNAACVSAGGSAYASCERGRWTEVCQCITAVPPPMISPASNGAAGRAAAPSSCGDGLVQGGEQCDGTNLGGLSCKSLGFQAGGQLQCGPVCTVDTTDCRV